MSDPAQTVRLHILLCDGLSGLSRIVDRMAVVGSYRWKSCFGAGWVKGRFFILYWTGCLPAQ